MTRVSAWFDRDQMDLLHKCHKYFLDRYFHGSAVEGLTFREFVALLVEAAAIDLREEMSREEASDAE